MPALTVGCDPEFIVYQGERHISIDAYQNLPQGNIGTDHGSRVGELRPNHGSPRQVTENIRAMMQWFKTHKPNWQIQAGGGENTSEAIGGHIHIGGCHPRSAPGRSVTRWNYRGNRNIQFASDDQKLIHALDFFIGRRLKKVKGGKRKRGSTYGRNGDIEQKTHGFEYRTPPSWIRDPYLAESTMAIALRIAEMWQLKPTCFDELFDTRKSIARRRDYDMLIPVSGRAKDYLAKQVKNFKRVIFSKSYNMQERDTVTLWTNQAALDNLYTHRRKTRGEGRTRTRTGSTTITLQVCQLKKVEFDDDFENEQVVKVVRFAVPEVKIYPAGEYTPWRFQLTRDIRLRPDTIYIAKELRPYLKINRGTQFKVRFIEINRRRWSNNRSTAEQMETAVFYNAQRSDPEILDRIEEIFDTCARTKLRRSDAETLDDE